MTNKETAEQAQKTFDATYISSTEICKWLKVGRATVVHARRRGILPDPIVVNGSQLHLWERDKVTPFLEAWRQSLRARRRELIA